MPVKYVRLYHAGDIGICSCYRLFPQGFVEIQLTVHENSHNGYPLPQYKIYLRTIYKYALPAYCSLIIRLQYAGKAYLLLILKIP